MKRRLETGTSSKRVRRESEHFEELYGDGGQRHQQQIHRRKQQKAEPQSLEDTLKVTSNSAPIFEDQLCALEIENGKLWIGISGNNGNHLSIDRYDARAIFDDLKPYKSTNNTPGILGGTRTRTIGKRGKRNEEDSRQLGVQLSKHLHEARWSELQSLVAAGIEGNDGEGESLKVSLDEFWKRRKLLAETLQKQKVVPPLPLPLAFLSTPLSSRSSFCSYLSSSILSPTFPKREKEVLSTVSLTSIPARMNKKGRKKKKRRKEKRRRKKNHNHFVSTQRKSASSSSSLQDS
jgi:hypothetical protein